MRTIHQFSFILLFAFLHFALYLCSYNPKLFIFLQQLQAKVMCSYILEDNPHFIVCTYNPPYIPIYHHPSPLSPFTSPFTGNFIYFFIYFFLVRENRYFMANHQYFGGVEKAFIIYCVASGQLAVMKKTRSNTREREERQTIKRKMKQMKKWYLSLTS